MSVALQGGHFPARWMPDASMGFGYPFWNYYAPLAFYIAATFHLIGLSIVNAIKLTQILGFLGAGAGMYLLADDIFDSRPAAWLATAAYTYAPFHLVNIYVRGDSLGEFVAFAFYPLLFLGLRRLRARPGPGPAAFTAIVYAGLILSHNISALIFTPFAIAYAYLLHVSRFTSHVSRPALSHRRHLPWTAVAFVLGLALSAFYWTPALLEQDAVQLAGNLTGYFHYAGHFRGTNLVQPALLFNFDVDAAGTPFAMGLIQTILGLIGFLAILTVSILRNTQYAIRNTQYLGKFAPGGSETRRFDRTRTGQELKFSSTDTTFFAGTALLATFLITPWSRPLWDHLPLLPFVQFPWRWLSVQAFGLSMVIGGLAGFLNPNGFSTARHQDAIRNSQNAIPWILAISLSLLIIFTSLLHLHTQYLPIRDIDVTPERLMLYEMFTGNIGSTVRAEYLPAAVQPRPWTSEMLASGGPARPVGASSAELLGRGPASQQWQITVDEPRDVVFPTYWFPGWHASIDGQPAETAAQPNHGGIRVAMPAGTHQVALTLGHTATRRLAELVSVMGVLLLLALLARRGLSAQDLRVGATAAGAVAAAGLLLITATALAGPLRGPLTMDFSQMPYLHPNLGGVRFAGGLRLLSYELSTTELEAGQTLDIETNWGTISPDAVCAEGRGSRGVRGRQGEGVTRGPPPLSASPPLLVSSSPTLPCAPAPVLELALVSPAEVLFHAPAVISEIRFGLEEDTTLRLRVPDDATAGIYLPRLRIVNNGEKLAERTQNDAKTGVYYLQPIRIRPRIVAPEQTVGRFADIATLEELDVSQISPHQIEVSMTWRVAQPIMANYATSIRLRNEIGDIIAQADTQPCYGFCPTSLWEPSTPAYDRRWLDLPVGTPPGKDYQLEIVLYEAMSLASLGNVRFNNITLHRIAVERHTVPQFGFPGGLAIADFDIGRERAEPGEQVPVQITWWLQKLLERDPRPRLLLLDQTGEQIVHAQPVRVLADTPASHWPLGAYIAQSYRVTLPRDLLPGQYQIAVGLEDAGGWFAPDRFLTVTPSTRSFEPPALQHTLNVDFGQNIRLLGYDLEQGPTVLSLHAAWQALNDVEHRYKTFVHLFDPATEQIVAQRDAEPLAGERPTSSWIAGEVVTDSFRISTAEVPAGAYRLAIGLYDATTGERLPAVGPDGGRLPQDRVVLEGAVTVVR